MNLTNRVWKCIYVFMYFNPVSNLLIEFDSFCIYSNEIYFSSAFNIFN